jgi:2-haloacid dehalogenase
MTKLSRRIFLNAAATLTAASSFSGAAIAPWSPVSAQTAPPADGVKALLFDVYGTLVDWRNGVANEAQRILKPLGYHFDWLALADAWVVRNEPGMEDLRGGNNPYLRIDALQRRRLEQLRPRFGLEKLDGKVFDELALAWRELDAWKDVLLGLTRLHRRFLLAPCSNASIAPMIHIARRNGLPWDAILGAEIARDYKPSPRVYLASVEALALKPAECMMVAAHSPDLAAAAALGLRTAHVGRPGEAGPGTGEPSPKVPVDFAARSFDELADKLTA